MTRIDELRRENPALGFALYALEAYGPVTFEVHTPNGEVFPFKGWTATEAIDKAFPRPVAAAPETPEPPVDVFS